MKLGIRPIRDCYGVRWQVWRGTQLIAVVHSRRVAEALVEADAEEAKAGQVTSPSGSQRESLLGSREYPS
jgi:hypothetical protein